jgi:hypothetical protein
MTNEVLFNLAEKVGLGFIRHASIRERDKFEAFAKLVAEHEREACANLCDALTVHPEFASGVTRIAALAIRARGQA